VVDSIRNSESVYVLPKGLQVLQNPKAQENCTFILASLQDGRPSAQPIICCTFFRTIYFYSVHCTVSQRKLITRKQLGQVTESTVLSQPVRALHLRFLFLHDYHFYCRIRRHHSSKHSRNRSCVLGSGLWYYSYNSGIVTLAYIINEIGATMSSMKKQRQ
jgi:hypothetical protein